MNSKSSFKVRRHFTLFLILVLVLLACTIFLLERGLNTASNTAYQLGDLYEKNNRLQTLRLLFEEKRNYSTILSFHNYDDVQFEKLKNQISETINSFNMHLNEYVRYVHDFSTADQEIAMTTNLEGLNVQYNGLLLDMVEAADVRDMEALEMLLSEAEPLVQHHSAFWDEMQNYNQAIFYETSFSIDRNISYTTMIIVTVFTTMFVIIIIVGIIVRRGITILEESLPERIQAAPLIPNDDAALLTEMRKCVSDLKAVAYDLSKSAEDIKKQA